MECQFQKTRKQVVICSQQSLIKAHIILEQTQGEEDMENM